jgi:hypothetical protein
MTKTNPEIVIFCQAAADVPYVLDLYNKFYDHDISIYVINVKGIFDFISKLNLNLTNLVYINYSKVNFYNPFSLINEKYRIYKIKRIHFFNKNNANVFFFSKFEDWLTSSFILCFIKKNASIYYVNHYDMSGDLHENLEHIKLKRRILGLIFYFITGVKFIMNKEYKFPEFPILKYNITEQSLIVDDNIFKKYAVPINRLNNFEKRVLFFLSPPENEIFDSIHYQSVVIDILNILKINDYKIFVKGHPRCGLPLFVNSIIIDEFNLKIIDSYIPGEFIDMSCFDFCIGIDSTILSILAKREVINTFCIINLITPQNENHYFSLKQYLFNYSDKKLLFLNNFDEFINYLKNNN